MSRKRLAVIGSMVAVLALVASACGGGGGGDGTNQTPTFKEGGEFRIQTDAFEWSPSLDPTQEYLGFAFEFFNALHRPLLGYNHKSGPKGGNEVKPDLATDLGQVSADGLTWTFKLRKGVKFAPPINREVTSKDLVTAFQRLANPTLSAGGYPVYYRVIQGFTASEAAKGALPIAGIVTPDPQTIQFKLTKPTGDFRYRLTMAATAPMPEEVTKCMTKNGEYGRYQVATGPYMIEGTGALNAAAGCATMLKTPISGFDPEKHLRLVRNPSYDKATDSKENRSNYVDKITLTKNENTDDIFKKIEQGLVDGESAQPPATVIDKGLNDANFKDNFHLDPGDRTWYLFFNLTKAPFDDVNVRKAVNFIMDKEGLVRVRGGRAAGVVAEHIVPPDVLGGLLKSGEFDPYGPNHAGDLAKAQAAMKQSKYDTNKDGKCDESPACRNVIHGTRSTPPYTQMTPIIEQSLAKLGITLKTQQYARFYQTVQVPKNTPALGSGAGWGKDYSDASTFFEPLLSKEAIGKDNTQNYAFLGITADLARAAGIAFPSAGVPSADADITACAAKLGRERQQCWADLDKKIMNDMVPWVPYLWATNISVVSDAVVNYEYDQFAGEVSFVHVAIDESKQTKA